MEIIGFLLQHPNRKVYLRCSEETKYISHSYYDCFYSDHYDTVKSIELNLIPKIFDIIQDLNIKGIIFNKADRYFTYSVDKYIDELEKE